MTRTTAILLHRDCAAVRVPSGEGATLPGGIPVYLVQSLGGSFTVQAPTVGGLFRIEGRGADALGLDAPGRPRARRPPGPPARTRSGRRFGSAATRRSR
jgi:hypothetical protein